MTEEQQKIFDEMTRSIDKFMRDTFGTELAEGAKEMPPEAEDQLRQAAENMREVARAVSFTAKDASEAAIRLHETAYNFWGDLMAKYPKLNLDVCAGCGKRCLFNWQSGKDHPCPLYKRTFLCKIRHFLKKI